MKGTLKSIGRGHLWFASVIMMGICLRILWIHNYNVLPLTNNVSDSGFYVQAACELAASGRFGAEGKPTASFPPVYPAYLSLWFLGTRQCSYQIAQFANLLPSTGIVVLTFWLGRQVSRRLGNAALVIMALAPSQIIWSGIVMSEVLFTAFLLLAIALFLAAIRQAGPVQVGLFAVSGLLCGIATLTRGQAFFLALALSLVLLSVRRAEVPLPSRVAVLIACWLLTIVPWSVRSKIELGTFSLTTLTGKNFFIGSHEGATGGYHMPEWAETLPAASGLEWNNRLLRAGLDYLWANPGKWLMLGPMKVVHLWRFASVITLREDLLSKMPARLAWSLMIVEQVRHLCVLSLVPLAILKSSFRNTATITILITLVYWTLFHVLFFGGARYNFPMEPLVLLTGLLAVAEADVIPYCARLVMQAKDFR